MDTSIEDDYNMVYIVVIVKGAQIYNHVAL